MESARGADPERIGPYRIIGGLGSGGMGRVFLAEDADGRRVAVKLVREALADDAQFRIRFGREIDAAQRVTGRRTARLLDADADANPPWMAVEFLAGPTLQRLVEDSGALPAAQVRDLAADMAEALADIHAAGVIHRDLKPSNVLIDDDGARVIDFGVARAIDATGLTGTGFVTGSASYMSPEQAKADVAGSSSDVFSLGAVLYFAATGLPPFGTGPAPGVMYRLVHEAPDLTAVTDASLRSLIDACLAKDPERRPTPAMIKAWHGGRPLPAIHSVDAEETTIRPGVPSGTEQAAGPSWRSRRRVAAVTVSSLLLLALALGGWAAGKP
jgi:serine/threonine protein kinase